MDKKNKAEILLLVTLAVFLIQSLGICDTEQCKAASKTADLPMEWGFTYDFPHEIVVATSG
ncbi:MAG TPA: hypothetical protein VGA49_01140, partial [Patescibacteria group bacterium]